jgi:hypothetical protein
MSGTIELPSISSCKLGFANVYIHVLKKNRDGLKRLHVLGLGLPACSKPAAGIVYSSDMMTIGKGSKLEQ